MSTEQQITALSAKMEELMAKVEAQQTALTNADTQFADLQAKAKAAEDRTAQVEATNASLVEQNTAIGNLLNNGLGSLPRLVEEVKGLAAASTGAAASSGVNPLMDLKGLGKPSFFKNTEDDFVPWTRKVENFIIGAFGEEFREVLEWAVEESVPVTTEAADQALEPIAQLGLKSNQLFVALVSLTDGDSNDIVHGSGKGNGLEAWRRLHRRWDPSSGTRKRALLAAILDPGRCTMDDLAGTLEKWLQQITRYCRRKDSAGNRKTIDDDILISSLEKLVPAKIKTHIETNGYRLHTYEEVLTEVQGMVELHVGSKIYDTKVTAKRDPNAMDIDSLTKPGKGKGRGSGRGGGGAGGGKGATAKFQGYCDFCWKWGHKKSECRSNPESPNYVKPAAKSQPGGGKAQASGGGRGSSSSGGKGKGDGKKGKKGKGKGKEGGEAQEETVGVDQEWAEGEQPEEEEAGVLCCLTSQSAYHSEGSGSTDLPADPCKPSAPYIGDLCAGEPVEIAATNAHQLPNYADPKKGNWLRFLLDSGASQTCFPAKWLPGGEPDGTALRTASGELVPIIGPMRLTAQDEWNDTWSLRAKRMERMSKPLVSTAVMAGSGWDVWETAGRGYIYKRESAVAKKIEALLDAEATKGEVRMLPLYEEGGVYNFYLYMGESSKVEEANGFISAWPTKRSCRGAVVPLERQPFTGPPPRV